MMTERSRGQFERFAIIVRMMWIDEVIEEDGQINRSDIMRAFGLSNPQASLDLKRYMAANPRRIAYDPSARCYIKIEGTKPLFWGGARAAACEIVRQVSEVMGEPETNS